MSKYGLTIISILIATLSGFASAFGIFSSDGTGPSTFLSVHNQEIILYGKGIYKNMSAGVAPQGIAQDYVTLLIAIPLLVLSLFLYRKNSLRGKILLCGILGYFLVTYLFYTMMALYNVMFPVWLVILSLSFFGFIGLFSDIRKSQIEKILMNRIPEKFIGLFLMLNSALIAVLWLSIILPHSLHGTIPPEVEHYTTLVVQALDLSILLPAGFICGYLLYHKKPLGYSLSGPFIIFLSILMTALVAKIIAMGLIGSNIFPVVIIIPVICLICYLCSYKILRSLISNINQFSNNLR